MRHDARGVPVTAGGAASLQHYETAIRQFQSYVGDPIGTLDTAIAEDPDFVSGQLLKALVLFTLGERKFLPAVEAALGEAGTRTSIATERDRMLMQAVQELVAGQWHGRLPLARSAVDCVSARRGRAPGRAPDGFFPR